MQTGSGKTHTIIGGSSPEAQGIIPRAAHYIFDRIAATRGVEPVAAATDFRCAVQIIEVYNVRADL